MIFRQRPIHEKLARALREGNEDTRAPWDKSGVHGVQRPREWDEVRTVEANIEGERAEFVVLDDAIVIDDGPDDVAALADALTLEPPFRAEAVRRGEGVWAVAGRRIDVVSLPGADGQELEQSRRAGELSFLVDGERRFGSIPALERDGDYAVRARRLDGERWEIEASLL